VPWWLWVIFGALTLTGLSPFMWFLVLYTGYWVVFWQQYIGLPVYIHDYISASANVELILITDGLVVITLTIALNYLTRRVAPFHAVIIGTIVSSLAWLIVAFTPSVTAAVLSLFVLAIGEIIQSPRYYDYVSRLAPSGQQGTYMGFAFLPIGIGSLIGGWYGGTLLHEFGEVQHQPYKFWWVTTAVGMATALTLWMYDRLMRPAEAPPEPAAD